MTDAEPSWQTNVTALIALPGESGILFLPREGGWTLPTVTVDGDHWFPDVAPALPALREQFAIDAVVVHCLDYQVDCPNHRVNLSYLLEPRSSSSHPALPPDARWFAAADLDQLPLADPSQRPRIAAAYAALASPRARPPWVGRGWFADAAAWAEFQLANLGTPLVGPIAQLRTWDLSAVLCCPTTAGDVYFKASAHMSMVGNDEGGESACPLLFAHEPRLLASLAPNHPDNIPLPLAVDEDRVWMLLPDLGPSLRSRLDVALWETALRAHARHQVAYVDEPETLLSAGCLDRRLDVLPAQIDRLLTADALLAPLDPAELAALHAAVPRLRAIIDELAAIALPATLVHGDLHVGNVAARNGRPIPFDWTDACLGHPFLDVTTFLSESDFLDDNPAFREQLRAAYLAEWSAFAPPADLDRALTLAVPLGALHQAVSYRHMIDHLEGPSRRSMASGGTFWLRQLLSFFAENDT